MTVSFQSLGLAPELLDALTELGYAEPSPIQAQAIPLLLGGHDLLGQAQTGTGKTAAFSLPILQQLKGDGLQMLVLAPTRELAIQVAEAVHRYGNKLNIRVLPVYGGQDYSRQIRRLQKGVHVVIGTPGRTLDLIRQGALDLSGVRYLVLDEADEMLKMGFVEDVEAILAATDVSQRQTALFSATFSPEIRRLAQKYMRKPLEVTIEPETVTVTNITQRYYVVQERDKIAALCRLLETEAMMNTLVFTKTKAGAADLAETLLARGYPAAAIHGDLPQIERERILRRFRNGQITTLVATDVVARGVDIPDVSHVVNFDIPQMAIEYVHRIGRTGRAGRSGSAITLISPRQRRQLKMIEDYIHKSIEKGKLPNRDDVLSRRQDQFKAQIMQQLEAYAGGEESVLEELTQDGGYPVEHIAAALLQLYRGQVQQSPLEDIAQVREQNDSAYADKPRRNGRKRNPGEREEGMVRLSIELGKSNGMRPGDIVYTIATQAKIPGHVIGAIDIRQNQSFLDVPEAHVDAVLHSMKYSKFRGKAMRLARA
jgi:ATP-dependent RNA helicase DeaD